MSSLIEFIARSPTCWHACETIKERLIASSFQELDEKTHWNMKPGKGYFVQRGASLAAFITPKKKMRDHFLATSHTDSPSLKLRPVAETEKNGLSLLHFEIYGAPILPSWLGRPLTLAGKVCLRGPKGSVVTKLVHIEDRPFVFPYVAFHLDRQVNENFSVNKQAHLTAIFGSSDEGLASCFQEEILFHELYCIPKAPASQIGENLILSCRLDNLASVYASCKAMCEMKPSDDRLQMMISWNHEEIGSETNEGAHSTMYSDIMDRLFESQGLSTEERHMFQARSFCISCDVAHAVHPNFPEKSESVQPACLGGGVVIKTNAQKRYMSDVELTGNAAFLLKRQGIQFQYYSHRNDYLSGSTVGPIHAAISGLRTIDVGAPLLSMHAAEELIDERDVDSLTKALRAFSQLG